MNQKFLKKATEIGKLVEQKNLSYGNSFYKSEEILKVLFPNGIKPAQYTDLLALTRVIDKLFRIANQKKAFEESPWDDIAGYAILGSTSEDKEKKEANNALENKKNLWKASPLQHKK
jgi:hypothetical protein